jgi:hypothetical protein
MALADAASRIVHNPAVRRFLAAWLLVVFAALATGDALACSDGCKHAGTVTAADECTAMGGCVFCTGSVIPAAKHVAVAPVIAVVPAPVVSVNTPLVLPRTVPDHPPRLS